MDDLLGKVQIFLSHFSWKFLSRITSYFVSRISHNVKALFGFFKQLLLGFNTLNGRSHIFPILRETMSSYWFIAARIHQRPTWVYISYSLIYEFGKSFNILHGKGCIFTFMFLVNKCEIFSTGLLMCIHWMCIKSNILVRNWS